MKRSDFLKVFAALGAALLIKKEVPKMGPLKFTGGTRMGPVDEGNFEFVNNKVWTSTGVSGHGEWRPMKPTDWINNTGKPITLIIDGQPHTI